MPRNLAYIDRNDQDHSMKGILYYEIFSRT